MNQHDPEDLQLDAIFAQQRADDAHAAPPFEQTLTEARARAAVLRRRRRARTIVAVAAVCALAAVVLLAWLPPRRPRLFLGVSEPEPLAFLLERPAVAARGVR